jgi:hypothetical protein
MPLKLLSGAVRGAVSVARLARLLLPAALFVDGRGGGRAPRRAAVGS